MFEASPEELDRRWMIQALRAAEDAADSEDVPVGAIVVREGRIIGKGCNQRERLQDPTAHAEILALSAAAAAVGHWRLSGCTMYVSLEPCTMCAGALVLSRIDRVVFGAFDPKAGACGSLYQITQDPRLNHRPLTEGGVLAAECGALLTDFFRARRRDPERT